MPEPPVRDFDRNLGRWHDRIELKLDNRQVFFLFFGSAVVACMLFVLGVMVGKRIESRGQADAAPLADPLAALDRARQPPPGVAAPTELSFPNRLIKSAAPAPKPSKPVAVKLAKVAPEPALEPAPLAAAPKPLAAAAPKPLAAAPKPLAAAPKPLAAAAPKPLAATAPKPLAAAAPKPVAAATPPAATDGAKPHGKFTLQLSTFATADDAAVFARNYPGAFVIGGEVPGKGTAYRVRYGNFASYKDASAAKESFEKQHNMIALIAAR
jgi:hypothetical protein